MSIMTEDNRTAELTTDGVETEFDFAMLIYADSEVQVWYEPDGGEYELLVLDTDYTVSFTEDGGTVTTIGGSSPRTAGKILIIRNVELTQETNWLYNDNHTGQQHQDDFDRSVMRDLQIQEQLDRSIQLDPTSPTTGLTLPEPEANKFLRWKADLTGFDNVSATLAVAHENLTDILADPSAVDDHDARYYTETEIDELLGGINYAFVSGNDAATDITAAQLEQLSDGSDIALHIHDQFYYTKDEVNDIVEGNTFDFFLNNTLSSIGSPEYFTMDATETGEAESTFSDTITGDAFLIDSFVTTASQPTFTDLVSGIYSLHVHADTTTGVNTKTTRLFWELYSRLADSPFTETLLLTSEESDTLTDLDTEYDMHGSLTVGVMLNETDRLIVKIYANIQDGDPPRNTDPLVTIKAEGTTFSHMEVVTNVTAFDDRYVFVTGDTMTGPLNMGTNAITFPGDIDGSVDKNAVLELSEDALWTFDGTLAPETGGGGSPPTLTLTAGTTIYNDRGTKLENGTATSLKGHQFNDATYYTAASYKGILGANDRTYNFWIKIEVADSGNETKFFANGDFSTAGKYFACRKEGATDFIFLYFGNGNVSSSTVLSDGQWHMITVVVPVAGGTPTYDDIIIYCDAVVDTGVVTNPSNSVDTEDGGLENDMRIGAAESTTNLMDGGMSMFAVFDKELSQLEITNIFNRQKERFIGGTNIQDWTNSDTNFSTSKDVGGGTLTITGAGTIGSLSVTGAFNALSDGFRVNGPGGFVSTIVRDDTNAVDSANLFINATSGKFERLTSSADSKDNIVDIPQDLKPVFNPRRYNEKKSGRLAYGLIAEEVAEVLPEAVIYSYTIDDSDPNNIVYINPKADGINWNMITTFLIKKVQALEQQIILLENK